MSSNSNPSPSSNNDKKRKQTTSAGASRKKPLKKSPFDNFGTYMVQKNLKLRNQYDANASKCGIFAGVSIFVDGFTVPSSQELKQYMLQHGGRLENYFSKERVTHIICSNLPDSKMKNFRAFSRGLPVVKPAWILESVVENKLLSWVPYQLYEHTHKSGKQRKLQSFFTCKSLPSSNDADGGDDSNLGIDDADSDATKHILPSEEDYSVSCIRQAHEVCEQENSDATEPILSSEEDCSVKCTRQDHEVSKQKKSDATKPILSTEEDCSVTKDDDYEVYQEKNSDPSFTELQDGYSTAEASNLSLATCSDPSISKKPLGTSTQHRSTLGDPNFVENYFKNSRLHFIGTWRNRYRKRFCNKPSGVKPNNVVDSNPTTGRSSVIHIDMDCFFVSVVVRNHPELLNKPIAVCHSDNPKGTAEISSANYPARDYGVKAGMFVRDAKDCCPELVIVPYDFEAYEKVADQFYSILHKYCTKVQAVSCDEAFLDVSNSSEDSENLALRIRKEIAETTQCTASAGIAENMLLARLATRSAKPNGQCCISANNVDEYLKDLPIIALPGIGHSIGEKLKCRQIHTCSQLRAISKEILHKDFGGKTGDMLWKYCRGLDDRAVEVVQETKSVGADVNWGVRFNDSSDCDHFLSNLCKEVSFRLQECGVEGRTITLKIKKRRKGAEEPTKFMGHGDCESMSRSVTLPQATDNTIVLERIAKQIFTSLNIDVKDIRGVGMQISKLETVGLNKKGNEKNSLESWLASSSGKNKEKREEPTFELNQGNHGEKLFLDRDSNLGSRQNDTNKNSPGTSHVNESRENPTSMLPELCHLDIEVIKNLPSEIFSEMNDMYKGKLSDLIKENTEGEQKNMNFCEAASQEEGNASESCIIARDRGKRPLCSPTDPVSNHQFHSEAGPSDLGNLPSTDEAFPDNSKTSYSEMPKPNLWLGKPPKWVDMFRISNCLLLNAVAEMYFKSGQSCNLSSVLQSLFSWYPPDLDLTSESWDEGLSSLCDLISQYVGLKVDSDIEELYICFRLLKRFSLMSKYMSELYNLVVPQLQVSVNEHYGGQLQLD